MSPARHPGVEDRPGTQGTGLKALRSGGVGCGRRHVGYDEILQIDGLSETPTPYSGNRGTVPGRDVNPETLDCNTKK